MEKILIGMTDFVLAETKPWSGNENESYEIAKSCLKYAQFLKQPLELWIFVPCDENGNVLEEPSHLQKMQVGWADNPIDDNFYKVNAWYKAKERCLFEGFRLDGKYLWHKDSLYMISEDLSDSLSKSNIEHLLLSHSKYEFELTPTAQKQISC